MVPESLGQPALQIRVVLDQEQLAFTDFHGSSLTSPRERFVAQSALDISSRARLAHVRPNWFIALPVDAGSWFAERVPEPPPGLRRFAPWDLHATISFLGPCGEESARAALEVARAWSMEPTPVTLGQVVPMGRPSRYSALSALLVEGRETVEAEMSRVRDAIADAAGARRDRRPPKAHVTLARPARKASDEEREAGLVWARGLDLRDVEVLLDAPALYTWSEDRREALFRRVEAREG